ncbi:MAG: BtpA/SgcQ family protein [Acidobacteriota bacterium]|nr:MAG: BtpA/SgcQ family protein [Acidobacteriota bacterium]
MESIKRFHQVLKTRKPIIAMAHLLPLPGSPLYDHASGMAGIKDAVARDVEALQAGGVDAIMFGNEGDRPYVLRATPESVAAMTAVVAQLVSQVKIPFGVNYLWDPVASVGIAHATGAQFVREVFTGVYDSDMGLWAPDAASAVRLRSALREETLLFYNINAEFASPVGNRSNKARAESAVFSSLADAVCVSGPMTGQAVEASVLQEVKSVLPETPVIANTGVRIDNVEEILSVADGVIIGTSLKIDGNTWNPVDPHRVERFMDKVRSLRGS